MHQSQTHTHTVPRSRNWRRRHAIQCSPDYEEADRSIGITGSCDLIDCQYLSDLNMLRDEISSHMKMEKVNERAAATAAAWPLSSGRLSYSGFCLLTFKQPCRRMQNNYSQAATFIRHDVGQVELL